MDELDDIVDSAIDCIKKGYECSLHNSWTEKRAREYAESLFPSLSNAVFLGTEVCVELFLKGFFSIKN